MSKGPWKRNPDGTRTTTSGQRTAPTDPQRLLRVKIASMKAEISHCDWQLQDRQVEIQYWRDRKTEFKTQLVEYEAQLKEMTNAG